MLFVSGLSARQASYRFRVLKLIPLLREAGVDAAALRYNSRLEAAVAPRMAAWLLRRRGRMPVVVFQKTRPWLLLRVARSLGAHLLTDSDDGGVGHIDGSPYPDEVYEEERRWIRAMNGVVTSTPELADWFRQWQPATAVIPTCLDVEEYTPTERRSGNGERVTVGWIGTPDPGVALAPLEPTLLRLQRSNPFRLLVVGSVDPGFATGLDYEFIRWRLDLEPSVFTRFDIGLNPLPDNDRARMKAGFKALQYMAAGSPVVASPVGTNMRIVRSGWSGFLPSSPDEWEENLRLLVSDSGMRAEMGRNARDFVTHSYALPVAVSGWCELLERLSRAGSV